MLHLIDSAGMYGAEKVILTLLEELKSSAFPGILGCIREIEAEVPQIAKEAEKLGIPVQYFTMKRGLNLSGLKQIRKFINDNNIHIVHSHGYKPNIFLSLIPNKKFKTIATIHGWEKNSVGIKGRAYEFLDSKALKRFDSVVAVSKAVVDDLMKRGIRKEKIDLIYNGIKMNNNSHHLNILKIRQKYGFPKEAFIVGSVGRLTKVKGHEFFIKAMPSILNEIENCHFAIAGEGPLKEDLMSLIKKNNLSNNVKLIGYTENIGEFLAMIDLFVMPSLSEGLPIALLEAMANGKPIIGSNVGGIPEVITSESEGILIPPADSSAISKVIKKLYHDKGKIVRMAAMGKKIVEDNFSSVSMAEKYLQIYSKITNRMDKN